MGKMVGESVSEIAVVRGNELIPEGFAYRSIVTPIRPETYICNTPFGIFVYHPRDTDEIAKALHDLADKIKGARH